MSPDDPYSAYRDEFGQTGPLPASDGQRQVPEEGFFTGPEIGQPLPGFSLRSTSGKHSSAKHSSSKKLDLHTDRGKSKACVVFFRSAVW
jgi:hypothetical protein